MANQDDYIIKIKLDLTNDAALRALIAELEEAGRKVPKGAKAIEGAMNSAGKSSKRFGNVAQNVGYQVQDMAVQIQGGVDPIRALSMQLPQMLVGFGALGAAIGVVAALLPAMISLFKDAEEETKDLAKEVAKAAEKANKMAAEFDQLSGAISNLSLDDLVKQFQTATKAQEEFILGTYEFKKAIANFEIDEALSAFQLPLQAGFESGQQAFEIYQKRLTEFGESIGLAAGEMRVLESAFRDAVSPITRNSENIGALVKRLQEMYAAGGARNRQLEQTIELLIKAEQATKALEQADASLLNETTPEGKPQGPLNLPGAASATQPQVSAAAQAAIDANDYKQMLIEAEIAADELLQTQLKLEAAMMKSGEGFSFADEMIKTFDQSFSTMLDGVLMGTQSLSDGIKDMAKVIIAELLKILAYQAIINSFGGASGGGLGQTFAQAVKMTAKGDAFSNGNVIPFAKGGIVSSPTLFPMKNGAGLMGEAGPEMVAPIRRLSNGDLGVGASPVNVTVNNMASGVKVNARQTEGGLTLDVVMDQIGAAIAKGGNPVANALESSYSLGRGRAVY